MPSTDPFALLLEKAAGQGFLVFLLVVGIYFVSRLMLQSLDGRIGDLKERITDHKERIVILETKVTSCEQDRDDLWRRIAGGKPPERPA